MRNESRDLGLCCLDVHHETCTISLCLSNCLSSAVEAVDETFRGGGRYLFNRGNITSRHQIIRSTAEASQPVCQDETEATSLHTKTTSPSFSSTRLSWKNCIAIYLSVCTNYNTSPCLLAGCTSSRSGARWPQGFMLFNVGADPVRYYYFI